MERAFRGTSAQVAARAKTDFADGGSTQFLSAQRFGAWPANYLGQPMR